MELKPPPPVRRIVVDATPTIIDAPVPAPAGHAPAAPRSAVATRRAAGTETAVRERMRVEQLSVAYDGKPAVREVSLAIRAGEVLALIGPSGCGKTTLLRTLNRLTELTPTARRTGSLTLDDDNVDALDVTELRRRVTMVFQQPNPFPMSIFDNVAYALREQARRRARGAPARSRTRCAGRGCGTRSRRTSTGPPCACPAASSSACASRARSRLSRRCSCSTSRARRWTRARRRRSSGSSSSCARRSRSSS
jgi:phosphate transport system ATP-binding protein